MWFQSLLMCPSSTDYKPKGNSWLFMSKIEDYVCEDE